jgi:hypothetical protein
MISPEEIRDKAKRLYPQAISAWLLDELAARFPWRMPANLRLTSVPSENIRNVQTLRGSSKESLGFGYTVHWEQRNSRKHGDNEFFPIAIAIESLGDLLKMAGKQSEFKALERSVLLLRERLPELEPWIQRAWSKLTDLDSIEQLIKVAEFLKERPRPGCFARELPLAIPTKLIENHRSLLTEWLDILLPGDSIDCSCDPKHFEQRYGFRYFRKHILTRILDDQLRSDLGLFTCELSLPSQEIAKLPLASATVLMVENQVTLLTLPAIPRAIGFFGMGMGITQLFHIEWLKSARIVYWGDLDVQGFQILAMLRRHYPNVTSVLMDMETIRNYEPMSTAGTEHEPDLPLELSESEADAFHYLRSRNLRIEQEHILQTTVNEHLASLGLLSRKR